MKRYAFQANAINLVLGNEPEYRTCFKPLLKIACNT